MIGHEGFGALVNALAASHSLTTLDVSSNRLGNASVPYLCKLLRENKSVQIMNFEDNKLSGESGEKIAESLEGNTSLRKFDLAYNDIPFLNYTTICQVLSRNKKIFGATERIRDIYTLRNLMKEEAKLQDTQQKIFAARDTLKQAEVTNETRLGEMETRKQEFANQATHLVETIESREVALRDSTVRANDITQKFAESRQQYQQKNHELVIVLHQEKENVRRLAKCPLLQSQNFTHHPRTIEQLQGTIKTTREKNQREISELEREYHFVISERDKTSGHLEEAQVSLKKTQTALFYSPFGRRSLKLTSSSCSPVRFSVVPVKTGKVKVKKLRGKL
eukprot:TRINITY_DN2977_c0_g1_i1.p1 TRINITY_DN2977_c0_g1~~TRINITY_DN2977_c0_g1_i1.p1  ORF type:complete len:335 (-),score=69.93 TRINITY_DN2977_c0_g1_i1:78-1082(-)